MRVRGGKRHRWTETGCADALVAADGLPEVCAEPNVFVGALPGGEATQGLLDANVFDALEGVGLDEPADGGRPRPSGVRRRCTSRGRYGWAVPYQRPAPGAVGPAPPWPTDRVVSDFLAVGFRKGVGVEPGSST